MVTLWAMGRGAGRRRVPVREVVGDLVDELHLSQPGVSKHLRVLRDAGLVEVRPDGQRRLYRLRPEPLMEIDEWLAPYRRLWARSLDRLGRHLEENP